MSLKKLKASIKKGEEGNYNLDTPEWFYHGSFGNNLPTDEPFEANKYKAGEGVLKADWENATFFDGSDVKLYDDIFIARQDINLALDEYEKLSIKPRKTLTKDDRTKALRIRNDIEENMKKLPNLTEDQKKKLNNILYILWGIANPA